MSAPLDAAQVRRMQKAVEHFHAGRLDDAERLAREVLDARPDEPQVRHFMGAVLLQRDDPAAALPEFETAAAALGGAPDLLANLGEALRRLGRAEEALARFEAARAAEPGNALHDYNVGNALFDLDRWEEAGAAYRAALARAPNMAEAHANLGNVLLKLDDPSGAVDEIGAALQFAPQDARLYVNLGQALRRLDRLDEARERARTALALMPGLPTAEVLLGECAREAGETEEAIEAFERALAADPDYLDARVGLANALTDAGRLDDAAGQAEAVLARDPGRPEALAQLAHMRRIDPDDPRLDGAGDDTPRSPEQRIELAFAAAAARERAGDHDAAFDLLERANALKRTLIADDSERVAAVAERLVATVDRELIERFAAYGSADERPVFVVGMPRSGTTLAEQIIASHPRAAGAGELPAIGRIVTALPDRTAGGAYPACLAALDRFLVSDLAREYLDALVARAGEGARLVDKMPPNYLHLGLIAMLFPRARIVHTRRHPLDTCLSCYAQNFTKGMGWAYGLDSLARVYRAYARVMDHWRAVLPLEIFEFDYEAVVDDPEARVRALIDFCGLEWDDRCLRFHETQRSVRTASRVQVRQPLYASSVGRWRRFGARLAPLAEALDDLIPEGKR